MFSGSVFGGVFDKKDESVVFTCNTEDNLFLVDMNEKTITRYTLRGDVVRIYKIVEENEVRVKGKVEVYEIILHKHSYLEKNAIEVFDSRSNYCFIGDKKF